MTIPPSPPGRPEPLRETFLVHVAVPDVNVRIEYHANPSVCVLIRPPVRDPRAAGEFEAAAHGAAQRPSQ
jgi:hypothetical protein